MAQKKASEVGAWLNRPDDAVFAVLCYGPDRGLVSETAARYATQTKVALDDPFSVAKIDADALAEPGRLLDEARTVALFTDMRLLWVRDATQQRGLLTDLKVLCESPPSDARILIEAGDLKKTAPLRTLIEGCHGGMALPCYADETRGLDQLIDEELRQAGLAIGPEVRSALRARLGGDRLLSRGELRKLFLYAHGKPAIELSDLDAIVGDVSGTSFDDTVDAALAGNIAEFDRTFERQCRAGSTPFLALAAALRQLTLLQRLRDQMEREGRSAAAVVAAARPPVFFSRRPLVEKALGAWTGPALRRGLAILQQAVLDSRRHPALAEDIAREALLRIAAQAGPVSPRSSRTVHG